MRQTRQVVEEKQSSLEERGENGAGLVDPEEVGINWPAGLKPPRGARFAFVPISSEIHSREESRDIEVLMWELSYQEEKIAAKRAKGEMEAIADHRLRLSIRAVDGVIVEQATGKGDALLDRLMNDIGGVGRQLLLTMYVDTFTPPEDLTANFRARVRTGVVG